MADISKIAVGSTTYNIKDAYAREQIGTIITGGVVFIGITTTALSEGSTTNPITIEDSTSPGGEKSVTAVKGNLTIYRETGTATSEFIWDGNCWRQLGAGSKLKALAFKDTASTTYTPSGTLSDISFTGTEVTLTGTCTADGEVATTFTGKESAVSMDAYTPAGTCNAPLFTGEEANVAMDSYTPAGTLSPVGFSGDTVSLDMGAYTPEGTITQPTVTITTDAATGSIIPQCKVDETNEALSLTGVTFTATATDAAFTGTSKAPIGTCTVSGTITQPTFTGTAATLTGKCTAAGTVAAPLFTGTEATLTGKCTADAEVSSTFTGKSAAVSMAAYTPAGTITPPTFMGTEATITVS